MTKATPSSCTIRRLSTAQDDEIGAPTDQAVGDSPIERAVHESDLLIFTTRWPQDKKIDPASCKRDDGGRSTISTPIRRPTGQFDELTNIHYLDAGQ